jgi:hypothetical protein
MGFEKAEQNCREKYSIERIGVSARREWEYSAISSVVDLLHAYQLCSGMSKTSAARSTNALGSD